MKIKRIIRNKKLTAKETEKYREIRQKISAELPDLIARHRSRSSAHNSALAQLSDLLKELKEAREERDLSLSELTELTGMDRSAISKLESGQRPNPTVETLIRYAEAVGKRLVLSLTEE